MPVATIPIIPAIANYETSSAAFCAFFFCTALLASTVRADLKNDRCRAAIEPADPGSGTGADRHAEFRRLSNSAVATTRVGGRVGGVCEVSTRADADQYGLPWRSGEMARDAAQDRMVRDDSGRTGIPHQEAAVRGASRALDSGALIRAGKNHGQGAGVPERQRPRPGGEGHRLQTDAVHQPGQARHHRS